MVAAVVFGALVGAAQAQAALVYRQNGAVVVARDDGSAPRVVAKGFAPAISPDGRRIAYFVRARVGNDNLRLVGRHGGRSRQIAHNVYPFSYGGSQTSSIADIALSWSPDGRWIAVAAGCGALLIDLAHDRRHCVHVEISFGGASFSPSSTHVAIGNQDLGDASTIMDVALPTLSRRFVSRGVDPIWGVPGIAYINGRLMLRRRPQSHARVLSAGGEPIAFSANGRRLLAVVVADDGTHAALVDVRRRRTTILAPRLSSVDALSRDGKRVLAEAGGNVVELTAAGAVRVLVPNASGADWN